MTISLGLKNGTITTRAMAHAQAADPIAKIVSPVSWGHKIQSRSGPAIESASPHDTESDTGTQAKGISAKIVIAWASKKAVPFAKGSASGATTGAAKEATELTRLTVSASVKSGATTRFATGETSGNCEKSAAENGVVATMAANVSARGSAIRRTMGTADSHDEMSGMSAMIPSVDIAERKNDIDTLDCGEMAMITTMHAPSAESVARRRRARNDVMPTTAIAAARSADMGIPVSTR